MDDYYNPYSLVELLVNGLPIHGRPYEFDSEVADNKTMRNAAGGYVKPTKLSSCCPQCGHGLWIDVLLPDPPFQPIEYICPHCGVMPPPPDPYQDPIDSGTLDQDALDPAIDDLEAPLLTDESTVADRLGIDYEDITDPDNLSDLASSAPILDMVDGPEVQVPEPVAQEPAKPEPIARPKADDLLTPARPTEQKPGEQGKPAFDPKRFKQPEVKSAAGGFVLPERPDTPVEDEKTVAETTAEDDDLVDE